MGGIGATELNITGFSTVLGEFNVGPSGSVLTVLGIGGSVGVGTQLPRVLLDVRSPVSVGQTAFYVQGDSTITGRLYVDDIQVRNIYSTGIATFPSIDISSATITNLTGTNLNISGVSTLITAQIANLSATNTNLANLNVSGITSLNSLSIGSTQIVSNTRELQNIVSLDAVTTTTIENAITNAPNTFTDLSVSGFSTFSGSTLFNNNVIVSGITTLGITTTTNLSANTLTVGNFFVNSGIVSAITGIITYYGDGSRLSNTGIGINSTGFSVGYGITTINFRGSAVSTIEAYSGIATVTLTGGSGGGGAAGNDGEIQYAMSGSLASSSNLTFDESSIYLRGRTGVGIGTSAIDALNTPAYVQSLRTSSSIVLNNKIGIGTTIPIKNLEVVGDSLVTGNLQVTGITTSQDFDSLSDVKLKENIETVNDALEIVSQLRGVKFNWKESKQGSYGVIAQELETILPDLVRGSDTRTVNYNGIIGILIESVKELKNEVERLKK